MGQGFGRSARDLSGDGKGNVVGNEGKPRNRAAYGQLRRFQEYLCLPDYESRLGGKRVGTAEAIGDTKLPAGILSRGGGMREGDAAQMDAERIAGDIGQVGADEHQESDRRQSHYDAPATASECRLD